MQYTWKQTKPKDVTPIIMGDLVESPEYEKGIVVNYSDEDVLVFIPEDEESYWILRKDLKKLSSGTILTITQD